MAICLIVAKVLSSGGLGEFSSIVDARLVACRAMKDSRYRCRARAGLISSSVRQASGPKFASGCGSDVFRAESWWLVMTLLSLARLFGTLNLLPQKASGKPVFRSRKDSLEGLNRIGIMCSGVVYREDGDLLSLTLRMVKRSLVFVFESLSVVYFLENLVRHERALALLWPGALWG